MGDKNDRVHSALGDYEEKGVSTYALINKYGISSSTIHRLRHNLGITTQLIDDLCRILDCRVEDIALYVEEDKQNRSAN